MSMDPGWERHRKSQKHYITGSRGATLGSPKEAGSARQMGSPGRVEPCEQGTSLGSSMEYTGRWGDCVTGEFNRP